MIFNVTSGGGTGQLKSAIIVTAPTGSNVTATSGSTVKNAAEKNGVWTFQRLDLGTWTITATKDGKTATQTVNVSDINVYRVKLEYVHVYGIQRDITNPSPAWTRTDEAVGMTATASVGTVAGHSDFSSCYPWSGIKRETLSTGDVMVKIPKFWYRRYRDGNIEHIQIADKAKNGFTLHPAFNHANTPKDSVYVGAYKTSSGNKSISGATPQASQTRATFRTNAKAKGTGWGIIDISTLSAIQMLILVEFATNDAPSAVGRGYCDNNSGVIRTGTCNGVSGLTGRPAGTNGKVDVVYRGIEGIWGNIAEMLDGINMYNGTYYVCNDQAKYADESSNGYTALSEKHATNMDTIYIKQMTLDTGNNPHIMVPASSSGGSETTYFCDACWSAGGWNHARISGDYNDGTKSGLFYFRMGIPKNTGSADTGCRLIYIPA